MSCEIWKRPHHCPSVLSCSTSSIFLFTFLFTVRLILSTLMFRILTSVSTIHDERRQTIPDCSLCYFPCSPPVVDIYRHCELGAYCAAWFSSSHFTSTLLPSRISWHRYQASFSSSPALTLSYPRHPPAPTEYHAYSCSIWVVFFPPSGRNTNYSCTQVSIQCFGL